MTTTEISPADLWLTRHAELERTLAGREPAWLARVRREAIARFRDTGFPTVDDEEFRFTNIAPIARTEFRAAPAAKVTPQDLLPFTAALPNAHTMVLVNGRCVRELSNPGPLPVGMSFGCMAAALKEFSTIPEAHLSRYANYSRNAFVALNTAFLHDGVFVYVPRGTAVDHPLHLLFVTVPGAEPIVTHPRNLILIERGCQVKIIESYVTLGDGVALTNGVTEIVVDETSTLDHIRIQRESETAYHVGTLQALLGRSATLHSHNIVLGGRISRVDLNVVLDDPHGQANLNGLWLAAGEQLIDNHTMIDHAKPDCGSREQYKGILLDHARGVFNGKVFVRPDAQKTDAKQNNHNLLLSQDAQVTTKPQLEILANDVKCTHGATIGQLDEEQVFYLRARGIDERTARSILTHAFASEILQQIGIPPLRDQLEQVMFARLPEF